MILVELITALWQYGWHGKAGAAFLIVYSALVAYGAFIVVSEILK